MGDLETSGWLWLGVVTLTVIVAGIVFRRRGPRRVAGLAAPSWKGEMDKTDIEDIVKEIHKLQGGQATVDADALSVATGLSREMAAGAIQTLVSSGWARRDESGWVTLTAEGRERAQTLIRIHRLWERYLADREGLPPEAIHAEADRREHDTLPAEAAELDAELGHPAWDPHGHIIPAAGSTVFETEGFPLASCNAGKRVRVLQIDDKSPALLAQLMVMGLSPGADVEVLESERDRLGVRVSGSPVELARVAAERVAVMAQPVLAVPLGELPVGSRGTVVEIRGAGKHQRRMLDMGLVPGAEVAVLRAAPLGDPVEYGLKGAAVSMRRSDANTVIVDEVHHDD